MESYLSASVTLVVGFVALEVYRRQKRDEKKNAARIILVEIENAERQLSVIKENGNDGSLLESSRLMSSYSWEKYRHMFGQNFTPREWDTISDFYNRCLQYDKAVEYDGSSFYHDIEAFRTSVNNSLALGVANIITNNSGLSREEVDAEYKVYKDKLIEAYMGNLHIYSPNKPINDAAKALKDLNSTLSLTSVGDKLRKMSHPTIWQRMANRT